MNIWNFSFCAEDLDLCIVILSCHDVILALITEGCSCNVSRLCFKLCSMIWRFLPPAQNPCILHSPSHNADVIPAKCPSLGHPHRLMFHMRFSESCAFGCARSSSILRSIQMRIALATRTHHGERRQHEHAITRHKDYQSRCSTTLNPKLSCALFPPGFASIALRFEARVGSHHHLQGMDPFCSPFIIPRYVVVSVFFSIPPFSAVR